MPPVRTPSADHKKSPLPLSRSSRVYPERFLHDTILKFLVLGPADYTHTFLYPISFVKELHIFPHVPMTMNSRSTRKLSSIRFVQNIRARCNCVEGLEEVAALPGFFVPYHRAEAD